VGEVIATLDRLGLRRNTVVVVTSDHGEEFWEHGGVEHGHTLYDELIRVPLIIAGPGIGGRRIDEVARLIDLAPTILDLSGADASSLRGEGRSLRPLLEGSGDEARVALSEGLIFADEKRSLRTSDLKYVQWSNGKEELYDLRRDPAELRDVSSREELASGFRGALKQTKLAQPTHQPIAPQAGTTALQERLRALGYGK
jgi:arylsulfatase A-like enzyme